MTPKVSIIVPIYNAGKFLEKCLDTLVNQTLKDIEIILVLDCPTDGSDRIAREYAEKDPRIRLIVNGQNLNIGLSRNEGLKIARGEYIGFSDHDDWRELNMYEKLYQKAREDQADIAISNFDSIYPDRIIPHPYYPDCPNQEQLKQEIFSHLIGDWKKEQEWRPFTHWGYMWHILYKREILENHNIWFSDSGLSCSQPNHLYSPDTLSSCFSPKKPGKQLYLQFNPTGDQPFNVLGSLPHYPSPQR